MVMNKGETKNSVVVSASGNTARAAKNVRFEITSLIETGTNNGNGKLDPGETPQVSFTVKDAAGANIPLSSLSRFEMVMSGPTENPLEAVRCEGVHFPACGGLTQGSTMPTRRKNGQFYVKRTFRGVGAVYKTLATSRKTKAVARERVLESLHAQGRYELVKLFNDGELRIEELEEAYGRARERFDSQDD